MQLACYECSSPAPPRLLKCSHISIDLIRAPGAELDDYVEVMLRPTEISFEVVALWAMASDF